MRILHVIDYLAASDGHAAVCLRLAEEEARRGHVCAVATARAPADGACAAPPGVDLRHLPLRAPAASGWRRRLPGGGAVARLFREFRPDCVHLHGLWDLVVLAAARQARRAGVPAVLSPHGVLAPWVVRRRRLAKRLAWHLLVRPRLRGAAALLAASAQEAEDIRRWGWRRATPVIPFGADVPDGPEAGAAAAAPPAAVRTLLFLSRLHAKKGLPLLLQAWAAARPAGWRLLIAGPGSSQETAAVRAAISQLGLAADVQLAGEVRGAGREALYRGSDLFVLPSHTENFGLVVAEALAHGLPAIATHGTPWSELPARRCGWWVEADAAALARALREATALTGDERRAMGRRGRELVRERYTWSACADATLACYERARAACRPPAGPL
jgi:glycosyltransferase involved in cell wall biosynthesis